MRNIVYRRVSTVDHGQSTDRQFYGAQFDLEFEDMASGKNTHRPALQACLAELQKGDMLHVWDISRLSRSTEDLLTIVSQLNKRGISIRFHKEGLEFTSNPDDPMKAAISKMLLSMLGAVAEMERIRISESVKDGLAAAKAKGKKLGGSNPGRKLVAEREYKQLKERDEPLRDMLTAMRKNTLTMDRIASTLNDMGHRTPRGSEHTAKSVQRILIRLGIE